MAAEMRSGCGPNCGPPPPRKSAARRSTLPLGPKISARVWGRFGPFSTQKKWPVLGPDLAPAKVMTITARRRTFSPLFAADPETGLFGPRGPNPTNRRKSYGISSTKSTRNPKTEHSGKSGPNRAQTKTLRGPCWAGSPLSGPLGRPRAATGLSAPHGPNPRNRPKLYGISSAKSTRNPKTEHLGQSGPKSRLDGENRALRAAPVPAP